MKATGDARLAERVDDLLDLERQVLVALDGAQAPSFDDSGRRRSCSRAISRPRNSSTSKPARSRGIALAAGGPTSHVAILAGTLGIPMLVAVGAGLLDDRRRARSMILDADEGVLRAAPDAQRARGRARRGSNSGASSARATSPLRSETAASRAASASRCSPISPAPSRMRRSRVAEGAEGCGLLRTEFLFLERTTAPDEDEQRALLPAGGADRSAAGRW